MSTPKPNIFSPTKEHAMLRELTRKFAEEELEPGALERDAHEFFDKKLFKKLGDLGLLGLTAPEEYHGSGMDATAAVLVHEELAAVDPGFTLAYLAHSMLCVNNIAQNCNEEQKARYLPKLCSGEWIGAMAMSEPQAGTDVMSLSTSARESADGFVINGRKMWITNGAQDDEKTPADILFLYAKTASEDKKKLSSFIIENGQTGYSVGQKLGAKLGMRASLTAELVLDDCHVRANQLVGSVGDALLHMMHNLQIERLTLAAMSLGIARRCLVVMNKYASERVAFNKPIAKFGQIQKYIAESYAKYKASRAYVYNTAFHTDLSKAHGRVDSDGVKLMASTAAKEIADAAIQVLGGYGYMGEYVVERLWRDAKLLEIGGGTLEAHQKNMTDDLQKRPHAIFE
jgi:isovaleryl-CoA dehydrogenase